MRKNKCALCGGKINSDGICTECGYNNRPTLKNRKSSASGFSFGYVILIASAVIFTALAIAIVHTSINMEKDYKHSFVLGPGMHHVGTDIPAGKYHIQTEKNESSIRDLWNSIKHDNLCLIGILEEEEREKGAKNILEDLWMKTSQT